MRASLERTADVCADLLWPPRCAGCDRPGDLLCPSCRDALPLIARGAACPICGAPDGTHGCAECGRTSFAFREARCAGVLEWPLSRAITLHKDAGELRMTPVLAQLLAEAAGEWAAWAHAAVPVPASPGARMRRGFDHGALLAAAFGACTGVPALDALQARPRRDQRGLSRERRRDNARSSIELVPGVAVPSRVLVLDDVFTTGATLDAATLALQEAGAREVRVLAIARACGGRL
ncbi:MAG: ComF family protein [Coriobacteriia bacterium]|nr:ComF family protein [Coriobacteriia bacterium]